MSYIERNISELRSEFEKRIKEILKEGGIEEAKEQLKEEVRREIIEQLKKEVN